MTLDTIIFSGMIRRDDTIVVGTHGEPVILKVKSLLKPKPLDEIRDPREKFDNISEVHAASGVKILAKNANDVIAGAPLRVIRGKVTVEDACSEIRELTTVAIETDPEGIFVKADAIGSLEAMSYLLKQKDFKISKAEVGDISERDIKDIGSLEDPLQRVILAFNIKTLPDVDRAAEYGDVKLIINNVIYKILEDFEKWYSDKRIELDNERRLEYAHPAKFLVMRDHIFRVSKPAVVGIRVLVGRIRNNQNVMRTDGKVIGRITSLQVDKKTIKEAKMGDEVAMAIDGPMVGRHFNEEDILFVDIPESRVKELQGLELSVEEKEVLDHIVDLRRKERPTWGMS